MNTENKEPEVIEAIEVDQEVLDICDRIMANWDEPLEGESPC